MRTKMAEVYDPKASRRKLKKKILKFFRVIAIIFMIFLFCVIGQYIVDHTIGQFPDLYDAIVFNNNFEREDIIRIFYGDTTAEIMYNVPNGYGRACYYHNKGLWVTTGVMRQDIDVEMGSLTIGKTIKGSDWYIVANLWADEGADIGDVLKDCNDTKLDLFQYDDFSYSYFAYIHPQSRNYAFSINGKVYEVELKNYDRWIPLLSE